MAGINLSQLNIPKSEEPVKRKHVVRLDELSDSYSNPDMVLVIKKSPTSVA
jgi:hypothetical protein